MNIKKHIIHLPEDFPFEASTAVITRGDPGELSYHWHECIEISFVKSGEGVYYVNGQVLPMKEGDIIIFNNMEPHAWHATTDEPMIQPVIVFDSSLIWSGQENLFDYEYLRPFFGNCTNFTNKLPADHPATHEIYVILNFIYREYMEKPPAYHLMIKSKLLEVMSYLIRYFKSGEKDTEPVAKKRHKLVRLQRVMEYLNENFRDIIKIEDAARMANMNASYFSTFFKNVAGLSFTDYITKLRIAEAVRLIADTDDTFASIAYTCGFNSTSNFYRAYKKFKGGIPADSRNAKSQGFPPQVPL